MIRPGKIIRASSIEDFPEKKLSPSETVLQFLQNNKGKKFGSNIIKRGCFNSIGGGYSDYINKLARNGIILKEDCPCGVGSLYWVKK